jgi:SPP1 gp7 family putative phage head morphogenesis protein
MFPEPITPGINWDLANEAAREWAWSYATQWTAQLVASTRRQMQLEITRWIDNGEPLSQLIKRLTPLFGEKRAELIATTETTRAFAEGNIRTWREVGIIRKKEWLTSQDERVCPICGPLHEKVVELEEEFAPGIFAPPAHPRCRCSIAPVVVIDGEEIV